MKLIINSQKQNMHPKRKKMMDQGSILVSSPENHINMRSSCRKNNPGGHEFSAAAAALRSYNGDVLLPVYNSPPSLVQPNSPVPKKPPLLPLPPINKYSTVIAAARGRSRRCVSFSNTPPAVISFCRNSPVSSKRRSYRLQDEKYKLDDDHVIDLPIVSSASPSGPDPSDLPKEVSLGRWSINNGCCSVFEQAPPPSSLPIPTFSSSALKLKGGSATAAASCKLEAAAVLSSSAISGMITSSTAVAGVNINHGVDFCATDDLRRLLRLH